MFGGKRKTEQAEARAELEQLEKEVESTGLRAYRDGTWLLNTVKGYLAKQDPAAHRAALDKKFPKLKRRAASRKLIGQRARRAGVVGGVTGGLVNASSILGFLTLGAGLAAGSAAFLAELIYTFRLQLGLSYDIALLNGVTIDPDDPADLLLVLGAALGVQGPVELLPKRRIHSQSRLIASQFATKLGMAVVQRGAMKFALPVVCVAISGGLNYYRTRKVGQVAADYFERQDEIQNLVGGGIPAPDHAEEKIILPLVFAMAKADGAVDPKENQVFRQCMQTLRPTLDDKEWNYIKRMLDASREELIAEVLKVEDPAMRRAILDILDLTMRIDGEIHPEETRLFAQVARCFRGEDPFEEDTFPEFD